MREGGAVRSLSRLHEISVVFIRHGLGDLAFNGTKYTYTMDEDGDPFFEREVPR